MAETAIAVLGALAVAASAEAEGVPEVAATTEARAATVAVSENAEVLVITVAAVLVNAVVLVATVAATASAALVAWAALAEVAEVVFLTMEGVVAAVVGDASEQDDDSFTRALGTCKTAPFLARVAGGFLIS